MQNVQRTTTALLLAGVVALLSGCGAPEPPTKTQKPPVETPAVKPSPTPTPKPGDTGSKPATAVPGKVAANPTDVAVMINKSIMLPDGYTPSDLVEPNVMFTFKE